MQLGNQPNLTFHDLLQFQLQGLDGSSWVVPGSAIDSVNGEFSIHYSCHVVILQEDHSVGVFNHSAVERKHETWQQTTPQISVESYDLSRPPGKVRALCPELCVLLQALSDFNQTHSSPSCSCHMKKSYWVELNFNSPSTALWIRAYQGLIQEPFIHNQGLSFTSLWNSELPSCPTLREYIFSQLAMYKLLTKLCTSASSI